MGSSTGYVMTLANSIIGVSVLAMPYCFKQCGIILSVLMLVLSSAMTRLCCHFLIKSATLARRRNYEFLAFHTFGPTGKLAVELSIIGFLLGTCIAFFVVMGDLGPDILTKAFDFKNTAHLRPSVLICLAVFVVLPLGLLRNVDSLSSVCTASILFYLCLVLKIVSEATPHLLAADWLDHVHLWRPAGILQCMPIFSMALACQTQVFEIYESLPDASLSRMNEVVRAAVNMCTGVYICVGFFGYVAFCTQNFSGNVLMSFSPSMATDVIKLGFVLSVAVSFPLVIFPCRASLYSLLFKRVSSWHPDLAGGPTHIPEGRFKWLTVILVGSSLIVGLLLPNIELVLGLVGSTIGTIICLLLPALMFTRLASKYSSERLVAQVIFFAAAAILVLSTYANLYAADKAGTEQGIGVSLKPPELRKPPVLEIKNMEPQVVLGDGVIGGVPAKLKDMVGAVRQELQAKEKKEKEKNAIPESAKKLNEQETVVRVEPPVPVEPGGSKEAKAIKKEPVAPEPPKVEVPKVEAPKAQEIVKQEAIPVVKQEQPPPKLELPKVEVVEEKKLPPVIEPPVKPADQVAQDAIRKEDEEREAEDGLAAAPAEPAQAEQQQKLLAKLEEHKQEQQKLLEQQKELLAELKDQNIKDSDNKQVELGKDEKEVVDKQKENEVLVKDAGQKKREAMPHEIVPLSAKLTGQAAGAQQNLSAIFMGLQKLTKDFSDVIKQHQDQLDPKALESNKKDFDPSLLKVEPLENIVKGNSVDKQVQVGKAAATGEVTNTTRLSDINVKPLGALIQANQKLRQQVAADKAVQNAPIPLNNVKPVPEQQNIVQDKQEAHHSREKREAPPQTSTNETCPRDKVLTEKNAEEEKVEEIKNDTVKTIEIPLSNTLAVIQMDIENPNTELQSSVNQPIPNVDNSSAPVVSKAIEEGKNQEDLTAIKPSLHLSVPDINIPKDVQESPNSLTMLGKTIIRDLKSIDLLEEEEEEED